MRRIHEFHPVICIDTRYTEAPVSAFVPGITGVDQDFVGSSVTEAAFWIAEQIVAATKARDAELAEGVE